MTDGLQRMYGRIRTVRQHTGIKRFKIITGTENTQI